MKTPSKLSGILSILLAWALLSTLEWGTTLASIRLSDHHFGGFTPIFVYIMVVPWFLFFLPPLWMIFRRGLPKVRGAILYLAFILVFPAVFSNLLSPFKAFIAWLPKSGSALCNVASETLDPALMVNCQLQMLWMLLLVNLLAWAAPLSILEAMLVLFERSQKTDLLNPRVKRTP